MIWNVIRMVLRRRSVISLHLHFPGELHSFSNKVRFQTPTIDYFGTRIYWFKFLVRRARARILYFISPWTLVYTEDICCQWKFRTFRHLLTNLASKTRRHFYMLQAFYSTEPWELLWQIVRKPARKSILVVGQEPYFASGSQIPFLVGTWFFTGGSQMKPSLRLSPLGFIYSWNDLYSPMIWRFIMILPDLISTRVCEYVVLNPYWITICNQKA